MRIRPLRLWISMCRFLPSGVIGCTIGSLLAVATSCTSSSSSQMVTSKAVTVAEAPPPPSPVYECHWADEPIKIDGKANEKAWNNAPWITDFVIPWNKGDERKPLET